jgi:peptide/nickel transport system permease protein
LLRPSLPYILTSLAMMIIGVWQTSLILEKFFFWPGIGSLFFDHIGDFSITGGIIVLFAYLLVITVFFLDILYALVDPRVRIGSETRVGRVARLHWPPLRQRLRQAISTSHPRRRLPAPVRRTVAVSDPTPSMDTNPSDARTGSAGALASFFKEIRRYPSAIIGLVIIASLILVSIYTVIAIPYPKALARWRGDGNIWDNNPKFAQPMWSNWFRKDKLPSTVIQDSRNGSAAKVVKAESETMSSITVTFTFDYPYGGFPQDLVINIESKNAKKRPLINLLWDTPDGREVKLDTFTMTSAYRYSFDYQWYHDKSNLLVVRNGPPPWEKLFMATGAEDKVLRGTYQVRVQGFVFDAGADLDAEMVLYGQVYGMAGTDDQRRDLSLAILWGTPFSLLFGLLGAFGTGLLAMIIAAIGVWFGGWVDGIIQRITEVNMLLPVFPMAIMIYFIYTHNIWIILGVIILLSVFGNALKNFRAAFLQAKEANYIEAARAYSAGNWRIILRYMVPRIIPLLVPQLVALVPSYIFLEPTLAFVGIVDPYLPTWGKILMTGLFTTESRDMLYYMNLLNNPFLALEPIGLMFLTGLAFSLLGMALDRIFNPRLRSL